jgi:hypothetical protein
MANTTAKRASTLSRRTLLTSAGLGAGAAGAAALGLSAEPAEASAATPDPNRREVAGYRETDHVKTYYARARG